VVPAASARFASARKKSTPPPRSFRLRGAARLVATPVGERERWQSKHRLVCSLEQPLPVRKGGLGASELESPGLLPLRVVGVQLAGRKGPRPDGVDSPNSKKSSIGQIQSETRGSKVQARSTKLLEAVVHKMEQTTQRWLLFICMYVCFVCTYSTTVRCTNLHNLFGDKIYLPDSYDIVLIRCPM
jgi:hypothetical protein